MTVIYDNFRREIINYDNFRVVIITPLIKIAPP